MKKTKNFVSTTSHFIFMLLLFTTPLVTMMTSVYSAGITILQVSPITTYSSVGQSFIISMNITNVTNLNAWQLHLLFDPEMLNCTDIWVPTENIFTPYSSSWWWLQTNNTEGYILAFRVLEEVFGVNGSGVLCQIQFKCISPGFSSISIVKEVSMPYGTYLQDPNYNFMPYDAVNGVVKIGSLGFQENIFNVTQNSQTYQIIILSNSTITSFNYNDTLKTMKFDASGSTGTIGLSSIVISKELLNGTFAVLVNETAIVYGLFENQTHNFFSFNYPHSTQNIKILLTIFGDINGDRISDMLDISIMIDAFMSFPNHPQWNPLADINKDNVVDMSDISVAIENFMKTWNP